MNKTINYIPEKWDQGNSLAFAKWYKLHVKYIFQIKEDYNLINKKI